MCISTEIFYHSNATKYWTTPLQHVLGVLWSVTKFLSQVPHWFKAKKPPFTESVAEILSVALCALSKNSIRLNVFLLFQEEHGDKVWPGWGPANYLHLISRRAAGRFLAPCCDALLVPTATGEPSAESWHLHHGRPCLHFLPGGAGNSLQRPPQGPKMANFI